MSIVVTWGDLCVDALRKVQAVRGGENAHGSDLDTALRELNRMLDQWRVRERLIYQVTRQEFVLTPSHNPHTIGTGGDFNVVRPVKIERAGLVDTTVTPNIETKLDVYEIQDYAAVGDKSATDLAPTALYYERGLSSGLASIYFYRVPTVAYSVALYLWEVLNKVEDVGATAELPPAYEAGVVNSLALSLWPTYHRNAPVPDGLRTMADTALADIATMNKRPPRMRSHLPRFNR